MESSDSLLSDPISHVESEPITHREVSRTPKAVSSAATIENARLSTWVPNDALDGWMLLGANGRPVMRDDGSRVEFLFRDASHLAEELGKLPDLRALAGGTPRSGLADIDAGLDRDWDPERRDSYFADLTKAVRLLAYQHARTTEPEEAVRRAVAGLLGNPVTVTGERIAAFVPRRYDVAVVKTTANALLGELIGPETELSETDDIIDDPDPASVLALIGATKFNTWSVRRGWEKYYGKKWPRDPETGRFMDVSHKIALADNGTNDPWNIEPLPHAEHVRRHMEAGDWSRWAKLTWGLIKRGKRGTLPQEPN